MFIKDKFYPNLFSVIINRNCKRSNYKANPLSFFEYANKVIFRYNKRFKTTFELGIFKQDDIKGLY